MAANGIENNGEMASWRISTWRKSMAAAAESENISVAGAGESSWRNG
jgi:hypothetical protein